LFKTLSIIFGCTETSQTRKPYLGKNASKYVQYFTYMYVSGGHILMHSYSYFKVSILTTVKLQIRGLKS